jgi:hypothetical protein
MPLTIPSASIRTRGAALAFACAVWTASASADPAGATAPHDPHAMPLEVLERAFWTCDHRATTHGVDATPVDACTAVFEALKENKFGGDFAELLAWWRQNKLVEHTRLGSD